MGLIYNVVFSTTALQSYYPGGGGGGRGFNMGWGTGLLPFLLIGIPALAFMVWFEIARRNRRR